MAKDKLTDYSTTANSNTDVGGVDIAEGCPAGNINNGEREIMSHVAEWLAGTYPIYDTASFADPSDLTKIFRFDGGGITTSSTRVMTIPDYDGTLATLAGTETLSNKTLASPTITGTLTIPDDSITLAHLAAGTSGDILYYGASGAPSLLAKGTDGQFLTLSSGIPAWASIPANYTEDGPDATTSGSSHSFTGISAGTSKITVYLDGISLNGSDDLLIQIGAGSVVTSGYNSICTTYAATRTSTAGFVINASGGVNAVSGKIVLERLPDTDKWMATGHCKYDGASTVLDTWGQPIDLGSDLDRVVLTRTGSNSFDAGAWSIRYE